MSETQPDIGFVSLPVTNETFVSPVYGREFGLNERDIARQIVSLKRDIVTLLLQRNMDDNIAMQSETSNRNSFARRKLKETEHDKNVMLKI